MLWYSHFLMGLLLISLFQPLIHCNKIWLYKLEGEQMWSNPVLCRICSGVTQSTYALWSCHWNAGLLRPGWRLSHSAMGLMHGMLPPRSSTAPEWMLIVHTGGRASTQFSRWKTMFMTLCWLTQRVIANNTKSYCFPLTFISRLQRSLTKPI